MSCQMIVLMLLLILSATQGFGQQTKAEELRVQQAVVLSEEMPVKFLPNALTKDAVVMKKPIDESSLEIYLMDFDGNFVKQLDVIETSRPDRVFTSSTSTRVVVGYQDIRSGLHVGKVYDLESDDTFLLQAEGGDIVAPVASPSDGRILYQMRREGEPPRIYLANRNCQDSQFIADGLGQSWLPDGKGYILLSAKAGLAEAYRHGKMSKQEYEQELQRRSSPDHSPSVRYWLYHVDLEMPALIPELEFVNPRVCFSPKEQWMAAYDGNRIYVRAYSIRDGRITFGDIEWTDQGGNEYDVTSDFCWDDTGERLAYERLRKDSTGESYINGDIFVYDRCTRRLQQLTSTPEEERMPIWLPNGELIGQVRSDYPRTGSVMKFILQEK